MLNIYHVLSEWLRQFSPFKTSPFGFFIVCLIALNFWSQMLAAQNPQVIRIESGAGESFANIANWPSNEATRTDEINCVLTGKSAFDIQHDVWMECPSVEWYGNTRILLESGGSLEIAGDLNLFGESLLIIEEGAMLEVHGNLGVSGMAHIEIQGELVVNGSIEVSGEATSCGDGSAMVSGAVTGTGWCYDISLAPKQPLLLMARLNNSNEVLLSWHAVNVMKGDYFEVRRSTNGMTYLLLPRQPENLKDQAEWQGNYEFIDAPAGDRHYYYAVIHHNARGIERSREVIAISLSDDDQDLCDLVVVPNPCIPYCEARIIDCPGGNFKTQILDASGNVIRELIPHYDSGNNINYHINKDNFLMPGIYIINSQNDQARLSKRIIVK